MQRAKIQTLPIFYQSLADILFQKRIEYHFHISCSPQQIGEREAERSMLTFEEENAICYAAGYVLRAVRKKTSKSSKQMAVVDRGGLLHITDDLYRVFVAMELDI